MGSVIEVMDITVLCGHRTEAEQNDAYRKGFSKLQFPKSKHNSMPSMAVDIAPYPIDWDDFERFETVASVVKTHWNLIPHEERRGWELQWGGDWSRFRDMPHWELKRK
jgi:peptidoglycan L-alanyl-D-glutamate endopeptidase CwlK